jgi:hypothetical protein
VARADVRYQDVTSAVVHALTNSLVTLTAYGVAVGCAVTVITPVSGRCRRTAAVPNDLSPSA